MGEGLPTEPSLEAPVSGASQARFAPRTRPCPRDGGQELAKANVSFLPQCVFSHSPFFGSGRVCGFWDVT